MGASEDVAAEKKRWIWMRLGGWAVGVIDVLAMGMRE